MTGKTEINAGNTGYAITKVREINKLHALKIISAEEKAKLMNSVRKALGFEPIDGGMTE